MVDISHAHKAHNGILVNCNFRNREVRVATRHKVRFMTSSNRCKMGSPRLSTTYLADRAGSMTPSKLELNL